MSAASAPDDEGLRLDLDVVSRWGRYADPAAPEGIRRLTQAGRFREAFECAEVAAGPWPREDMFWFSMRDIAEALGLDDRVAYWERRIEDAEAEERAYTDALFKLIETVLASGCSARDGMLQVIDLCSRARPDPDWKSFKSIDYDADVSRLAGWLEAVLRGDPPADDVDGLWFGLSNPIRDGEATADAYVSGGVQDAANRERGFPYHLSWTPEGADARSQALDEAYKIAYRGGMDEEGWVEGLGNDAEVPLCLAYGCLAARWLVTTLPSDLVLGGAEERAIEVGFDSGDRIRVGTVTERGLVLPTGRGR